MRRRNYLYNGQLSTSRGIKIVTTFQKHFVFNIEIKRISLTIALNWEHYQIQCRLEVTSMHAEKPMLTAHDKQATENREPANEMNEEDPTQGLPVWLQPITGNLPDLESHVLARSYGRANLD